MEKHNENTSADDKTMQKTHKKNMGKDKYSHEAKKPEHEEEQSSKTNDHRDNQ